MGSNLNSTEASSDRVVSATTIGVEDGQTVTFTLNSTTYTGTISSNSASTTISSSDLQSLTDGNTYTITADVNDAAGNSATQSSVSFTVDFSAPILLKNYPNNNQLVVSIKTKIFLYFNDNVYSGSSGSLTIKNYNDDSTNQTINISSDSSNFSGWGSSKITVRLKSNLSNSTKYYINISNTLIKDNNDNYYAGISNNSDLVFTTANSGVSGSNVTRTTDPSTNEIVDKYTSNTNSTQFTVGLNDFDDKYTISFGNNLQDERLMTINEQGDMNLTGDLTCNEVTVSSDIRIKENIVNLENTLPKINKLRGVYYNLKKDNKKTKHIGFIAQEIEKDFPELVNFNDNLGIKTVNYAQFNSVLLEGMKEMTYIINNLSNKVNTLENKIKDMEHITNK